MIALDTNVLLRFLIEDDADQTRRAAAFINQKLDEDEEFFVSDIVLCEMVWVLKRIYRKTRREIVKILRVLLRADGLRFLALTSLYNALTSYKNGRGDFADYIIKEHAKAAGCKTVATFDKALIGEAEFISI